MSGADPSNIVNLKGTSLACPGYPDKSVIERLKWVLERAEAGEVTGIAYAVLHFDNAVSDGFAGARSIMLVGSIEAMKYRLLKDMNEL